MPVAVLGGNQCPFLEDNGEGQAGRPPAQASCGNLPMWGAGMRTDSPGHWALAGREFVLEPTRERCGAALGTP